FPTPPRYLALPRVVTWLPNDVFLPLTSHWRPIGQTPRLSSSGLLLGHRVVRLAALDVAAFLDQVADLVGRDRELALGADIEGRGGQRSVATPMALGRSRFPSLGDSHDARLRGPPAGVVAKRP